MEKDQLINKLSKELYRVCILPSFYKKRLWKKICKQKKNEKYDCTDKKCTECIIEYFEGKEREV